MPTAPLRKAGGSVTVTVPPIYLKENGLSVGSVVNLEVKGERLTISPARKRVTLADIISAAPKNAASMRAPGWDELKQAGKEE
ncbi:MAG TPA: AbrB/MazE/SpoVT family DNA-binding domain-containing protein [Nevskiaceae bacterium]|nr:AbrB/MazE/SpoVT family DNA-binding domain-containing protein [Nevskiaceae bacterium]